MLYGTNMKGRVAICKFHKLLVALISIIFSCISLNAFGEGVLFCFLMPYGTSGRTGNSYYNDTFYYNDRFFISPDAGIIKMCYNHPQDSFSRVWELIRYNIVK